MTFTFTSLLFGNHFAKLAREKFSSLIGDNMQLTNLPAVITGGASGLGAGAARVLAAAGAKVALLDLQMDKARALVA